MNAEVMHNPLLWAKDKWWDSASPVTKITQDRVITECVSWATFMGVSYVLEHQLELRPVKEVLAKVIKPMLPAADNIANTLSALETDEETASRQAMNDDERAYHYVDILFNNTVSIVLSMELQNVLQDKLDHFRGVGIDHQSTTNPLKDFAYNPYARSVIFDRTASIGSVAFLNLVTPKQNEQVQEGIGSVLQKIGMKEEDAIEWSRFAVNVGVPNLLGMASAVGVLLQAHGNTQSR